MRDRRLLAGLLLALFGGLLLVFAALAVLRGRDAEAPPRGSVDLRAQREGLAPFEGWTDLDVALGGDCVKVVVADGPAERSQGLRGVTDLGPYTGMLFVFSAAARDAFTMAGTLIPLDIVWYDARGVEVDRARMEPCGEGDDLTCPRYESDRPYRYALETPAGAAPSGSLSSCA